MTSPVAVSPAPCPTRVPQRGLSLRVHRLLRYCPSPLSPTPSCSTVSLSVSSSGAAGVPYQLHSAAPHQSVVESNGVDPCIAVTAHKPCSIHRSIVAAGVRGSAGDALLGIDYPLEATAGKSEIRSGGPRVRRKSARSSSLAAMSASDTNPTANEPTKQIHTNVLDPIIEARSERQAQRHASDASESKGDQEAPFSSEPARDREASFSWSRAWYAVNLVEQLDVSRPHGFHLLGRPLVLWRDKEGQWRCFLDQCPHRLVPLSEGRIDEQGNLQCSYHGWSFAACGACTRIPQLPDNSPAVNSRRACATTFPTRVASGIIFVWPDEYSSEEAARTPVPMPAALLAAGEGEGEQGKEPGSRANDGKIPPGFSCFMRDVPYGYEVLAENLIDPAHLPFAHHGVMQLSRSQAAPMRDARVVEEGIHGFTGSLLEPLRRAPGRIEFMAPSLVYYERLVFPKSQSAACDDSLAPSSCILDVLYLTPLRPGHSRMSIIIGPIVSSHLLQILPRWLYHLSMHEILDGDAYFLHGQELALQALQPALAAAHPPTQPPGSPPPLIAVSEGSSKQRVSNSPPPPPPSKRMINLSYSGASALPALLPPPQLPRQEQRLAVRWASAYYMPATSDKFIIAFRRWLDTYAGSRVHWSPYATAQQGAISLTPKEVALNRFTSHTKDCALCSKAYAQMDVFLKAMLLAAGLCAMAAFSAPTWKLRLLWAATSIVAATLCLKVKDFMKKFVYVGWDHASRH